MLPWIQVILTALCSVVASSGFWAYWSKRHDSNDAKTRLLIGLAHDRIMQSGMYYIERGYITKDEYENLYDYLYKPYKELGGNGSAERIMGIVATLPMRSSIIQEEEHHDPSRESVRDSEMDRPVPTTR